MQIYNKNIYLQISVIKNKRINCLIYKNLAFVKKQVIKIYLSLLILISQ